METFSSQTPHGPALVELTTPDAPRGLLVLGPGASGGIAGADLALAVRVALEQSLAAALVQPPYAVAGRRVPPRGTQTDEAFTHVVAELRARFPTGPLITGGRSYGSRVACRTVGATGADGVVCLAFPLQPPGGRPSRQPELSAVEVPTLIVQGERDAFGVPVPPPLGELVLVGGDHSLKKDHAAIAAALSRWLGALATGG